MIIEIILSVVVIGLLFSLYNQRKLNRFKVFNKKINFLSNIIQKGALKFLHIEYKIISIFVFIITLVLLFLDYKTAISFFIGAILSALIAYIGLNMSTSANGKTVVAAKKGLNKALNISFSSGLVTGITVVSVGVLGIVLLYIIFGNPDVLFGFGLGASLVALFLRVGGGIFTKAADVGADLVGKVENSIPEDDPRNPAVIADNVGDNVGDVAGMGSDLLESYVESIIASMALGVLVFGENGLFLPLLISAIGIISSILGSFFVKVLKGKIYSAIDKGIYASSIIVLIISFFSIKYFIGNINLFWCVAIGLIAGLIISKYTEYVTSPDFSPTKNIAKSSQTGAATNILKGLSVGMMSTAIPILVVGLAIYLSFIFGSYFGVSIAAVGMLSILGIILAADFYGPVVDNAQGISEMTGAGEDIQKRTAKLDSLGNSTAAITKGFAISSAAFTSIALFISYITITNLTSIDLIKVPVVVGLFIGAMLPFIFSSLLINAVEKAAYKIINEVRRQFRTIKGIMSGKKQPEYSTCILISTREAMRGMIIPGILSLSIPILIGLFIGAEAVGSLLAGVISSGFVLAVFMANSGGAWDNAKKYIEAGNLGGKGSDTHKASVVGDTVGDPFKDTCGPSIDIFLKLMIIVSLVFIPLII